LGISAGGAALTDPLGVLAVLGDASAVSGNTFSTAAVFAGSKLVQRGALVTASMGTFTENLATAVDPS